MLQKKAVLVLVLAACLLLQQSHAFTGTIQAKKPDPEFYLCKVHEQTYIRPERTSDPDSEIALVDAIEEHLAQDHTITSLMIPAEWWSVRGDNQYLPVDNISTMFQRIHSTPYVLTWPEKITHIIFEPDIRDESTEHMSTQWELCTSIFPNVRTVEMLGSRLLEIFTVQTIDAETGIPHDTPQNMEAELAFWILSGSPSLSTVSDQVVPDTYDPVRTWLPSCFPVIHLNEVDDSFARKCFGKERILAVFRRKGNLSESKSKLTVHVSTCQTVPEMMPQIGDSTYHWYAGLDDLGGGMYRFDVLVLADSETSEEVQQEDLANLLSSSLLEGEHQRLYVKAERTKTACVVTAVSQNQSKVDYTVECHPPDSVV